MFPEESKAVSRKMHQGYSILQQQQQHPIHILRNMPCLRTTSMERNQRRRMPLPAERFTFRWGYGWWLDDTTWVSCSPGHGVCFFSGSEDVAPASERAVPVPNAGHANLVSCRRTRERLRPDPSATPVYILLILSQYSGERYTRTHEFMLKNNE